MIKLLSSRFDGHEFVDLLPDDFTRDEYETLLQEFQVAFVGNS